MSLSRLGSSAWGWAAPALVCAILSLSGGAAATAQPATDVPATGDAREELYREVAQEVAALERQGSLLKKVVRLVKPTVVHIEAAKSTESPPPGRRPVEEAGSGVVIERQGKFYVLTNRHVIKDSAVSQIKLRLADGRLLFPTRVWADRGTDVAILAISASRLVPAKLADSDQVEIGDFVLAVGSPFGLSHSVTYGIISAKGRRDLKLGGDGLRYQDFLQTDAAINPGNSGGPLLNLRGEVIGINTAIASSSGGSEGIGFTIPINMAKRIGEQLIEHGAVRRAYLGVHLDARFDEATARGLGLPGMAGARVSSITPKSPADVAKLKVGDVILRVNNVRVEDDGHLVNLISLLPIGDDAELLVQRSGRPATFRVKVGNRNEYERE
jgi:serine protease Do